MKSIIATSAVLLGLISHVVVGAEDPQQPTTSPAAGLGLRQTKKLGCYSDPGDMWDMGPYKFQSSGWCAPLCVRQSAQYFGIVNGTNCFCGNSQPKNSDKTDDDECNVTCNGIDTEMCGGQNKWVVYDDEFRNGDSTGTIEITKPTQTWFGHAETGTTTSSSKKSKATSDKDETSESQSVVSITVSGKPVQSSVGASPTAEASSSPNKAGIAAGVVVGVIALSAIVGGVFFFIRRKKQKELEDERRRHEALSTFSRGEKPPSTFSGSDSRLEPSVMFQRRASDGSIADNQDYSRRILKVTNPDDR